MSHRHPERNERKQTVITEAITTQVNSLLTPLILWQIAFFQIFYPMFNILFFWQFFFTITFISVLQLLQDCSPVSWKALLSSLLRPPLEIMGGQCLVTADSFFAAPQVDKVKVQHLYSPQEPERRTIGPKMLFSTAIKIPHNIFHFCMTTSSGST